MATRQTIVDVLKLYGRNWERFTRTDGMVEMYAMALDNESDDIVLAAAQEVLTTAKRPPLLSDTVDAVKIKRAQHYQRVAQREYAEKEASYITHWERSPADRAEIDIARNECMAFIRSIGMDCVAASLEREAKAPPPKREPPQVEIETSGDDLWDGWE